MEFHYAFGTKSSGIDYDDKVRKTMGSIWGSGNSKDWLISISWRAGPFGDVEINQIGWQGIIKKRSTNSDEAWTAVEEHWGGVEGTNMRKSGKNRTGVPLAFDNGDGLYIGGDKDGNKILSNSLYTSVWALVTGDAQYFGEPSDWFKPQVGSSFSWT